MKIYLVPIFFIIIFVIENLYPFFKGRKKVILHAATNIFSGIIGISISKYIALYVSMPLLTKNNEQAGGIFSFLEIEGIYKIIAVLILFDIWMYFWHRMNHKITFLWHFHKAHHSDIQMDSSSAFRFHPGELFLSTFARIPIFMLFGINIYELVLYEAIAGCMVIFHHSNINLNNAIDKFMTKLIVSPNYHRIHHSDVWGETHSNYSSVLTIWDSLFGTRVWRDDTHKITLGLKLYRDKKWQNITGILMTPFKKGS